MGVGVSQRTTFGEFFPSVLWAPGIELRSSGFMASILYLRCHFIGLVFDCCCTQCTLTFLLPSLSPSFLLFSLSLLEIGCNLGSLGTHTVDQLRL